MTRKQTSNADFKAMARLLPPLAVRETRSGNKPVPGMMAAKESPGLSQGKPLVEANRYPGEYRI